MRRRVRYQVEVTHEADAHLAGLSRGRRQLVLDSLESQLAFQPTTETRNRKRLRPNPVAPWELRLGDLRVYFDVEEAPRKLVTIHAVGIKDRNRVTIGGVEVELK